MDEEKQLLQMSINEFEMLVAKEYNPSKEELTLIESRLKYLSEFLDRLNKFDWKAVLISTVVTIATTLTLSTEQGRQLFEMTKQVFTLIKHLQP